MFMHMHATTLHFLPLKKENTSLHAYCQYITITDTPNVRQLVDNGLEHDETVGDIAVGYSQLVHWLPTVESGLLLVELEELQDIPPEPLLATRCQL